MEAIRGRTGPTPTTGRLHYIRIGGANADAGYIVRCKASDRSVFDADSFSL